MCGFIVQFNPAGSGINVARLERMANDIRHRGPDDSGTWSTSWAGATFRRLAIQDLSPSGHQPLSSVDGRHVIVFNGEIYNQQSLRQELALRGYVFRSSGDTEVLLNSYREWGEASLSRLRGMFAFAIFDTVEQTVFVARDSLGIKPLYMMETADGLFFASEVKPFRQLARFEANEASLFEQLMFRYVAGSNTLFRGIHRLLPGACLTLRRGAMPRETRVATPTEGLGREEPADIAALTEIVDDSIQQHTLSDVGYVAQLSGGIDSSYIAATLNRRFKLPLRTLSGGLDDPRFDETPYQKQVAAAFVEQAEFHVFGSRELADNFERFAWHMDFPVIHTSCVFLMLLSERAVQHSKVMLTGEGADEAFAGYSWLGRNSVQDMARQLRRVGLPASLLPRIGRLGTLRALMGQAPHMTGQLAFSAERVLMVAPDLTADLGFRASIAAAYPQPESCRLALAQHCYLQGMLERQDRASMAASVEARVPFCDKDVYAAVNRIRYSDKLAGNTSKALLKTIAGRYFDAAFLNRRKSGYTLPLAEWLRDGSGLGRFLDMLLEQRFRQRGYFAADIVATMVREHRAGERDHSAMLMRLVSLEVWFRQFIDADSRAAQQA